MFHRFLPVIAFASLAALSACNSTEPAGDEGGPQDGAAMTYDGRSWTQQVGICPGTTDYVTTFTLTQGDASHILYIQSTAFPTPGTYAAAREANSTDSLNAGEVGVSLYDPSFNSVGATGGTVTITRPSASSLKFESSGVTFANGKSASFAVTATMGCED